MTNGDDREAAEMGRLEAGLAELAVLYREGAQLPPAADLVRLARLRERQIAAERLALWQTRVQRAAGGVLLLGVATITFATWSEWAPWLLGPLAAGTSMPAVAAGAVLASAAAAFWVLRQFAEE